MQETILCAAIYINDGKVHKQQPTNIYIGFVVCGRRHHNCYQTIESISGNKINDEIGDLIKSLGSQELRKHQGFITSKDRYVDRREAWTIAKKAGQILYGANLSDEETLISENLYFDE